MHRRSFTLIELLLAVGIIGALSAIVIVAVNPGRQLAQARNAQRRGHANVILNAINQFSLDNSGSLPSGIDLTLRQIGTASSVCAVPCGTGTVPPPPSSTPSPTWVTFYPTRDASMWQAAPNTNYGSDVQLWAYPWTPSWTRRFVVHFDVSSIPAGATINAADLHLRQATTFGATRTIGAHRLTGDFTESGVTWNNSAAALLWTMPGGDYDATPTDTAGMAWTGILEWKSWDVSSDVQAFVDGTLTNRGWLFKDVSEDSSQNYWFFHSKEEMDADDLRPYLIISYTEESGGGTGTETADACINLSGILVPNYIPHIPVDPSVGSAQQTHYAVQSRTSSLLVRACGAELSEVIEVER